MKKYYVNGSGHEMNEDDLKAYLLLKERELEKIGMSKKEIEEYILSFFDDIN